MARPKKEQKALNCRLDKQIWEQLDRYCNETGSNKTFVAEKAIREFLAKYEKERAILERYNEKNNT